MDKTELTEIEKRVLVAVHTVHNSLHNHVDKHKSKYKKYCNATDVGKETGLSPYKARSILLKLCKMGLIKSLGKKWHNTDAKGYFYSAYAPNGYTDDQEPE